MACRPAQFPVYTYNELNIAAEVLIDEAARVVGGFGDAVFGYLLLQLRARRVVDVLDHTALIIKLDLHGQVQVVVSDLFVL